MKPKNHVILIGEGLIAKNTAHELAEREIPFVQVVAHDAKPFHDDYPTVKGNASDVDVLRDAGIENARMVIAAMDDDGENAFISLVAKDLNAEACILAVASSARAMHPLKLARADMVFAPTAVGSRLLTNLVEGNEIPHQFKDLLDGSPDRAPSS